MLTNSSTPTNQTHTQVYNCSHSHARATPTATATVGWFSKTEMFVLGNQSVYPQNKYSFKTQNINWIFTKKSSKQESLNLSIIADSRNDSKKIRRQLNIYIYVNMTCVTCHLSSVTCHLSPLLTATAIYPPPAYYPTMHSRHVCKDSKPPKM